ncbi:hypothetical protein VBI23_06110 [Streptococcus uberis]|uniref:hypothetical protein n=1 Tax=Streptococcus uberis TaxID=1349 RepID=UPI0012B58A4D|nr:hypothetical protein [Streptococcus uberis]MCK1210355.1 hypothetical protein [Streptococcus uberis]MCK1217084.1 hypothetical protein [Streptococcus uberis]MCK1248013.1 hypothetical protein [Streptococcus uberis]MCK1258283.1 hypothetical protein [Streptococcus uberis]MEE3737510.1 hypothetical protein [Streptococcus uberis]
MNEKQIDIDSDIIDFFRCAYFGSTLDSLGAATKRAYLDFNRTIRFKEFSSEGRIALRKKVRDLFEKELPYITKEKLTSQDDFDCWHRSVCETIVNIYQAEDINFTIGQSQKWLNMTIKYLYLLGAEQFESNFRFLHVPIDNYILNFCEKEFDIKRIGKSWSKWENYDEYSKYQQTIRNHLKGEDPLRWEFKSWLASINKR